MADHGSLSVSDIWGQLVELSRRANLLQRRLQQAQCKEGAISTDTGAWCRNAVANLHITDRSLAAALAELFSDKTVLSLGEGQGVYRALVFNGSSRVELSFTHSPTCIVRENV